MKSLLPFVSLACVLFCEALAADDQPSAFNAQGRPNRNRPGPWDNDVLVVRAGTSAKVEKLATFGRAGVPTLARLKDDRLIAAHQCFPEDNDADFDKVAVHFSADEGVTWTPSQVIGVEGLPEGMRFPFDPTLVPLPDGRVRMYFTANTRTPFEQVPPAIGSAVSSNGVHYVFEPGMRFSVEGRPVIDCAVALHEGMFHLYAPDNGAGNNPGAAQREPGDRSLPGIGYHATSKDGLNFTRLADVQADSARRWLGNAQADGRVIRFFGTGGPGGVWTATSTDGQSWVTDGIFPLVRGADPGAVKLKAGGWLLAVTGPPRDGRQPTDLDDPGQRTPLTPLMTALDANVDGVIDAREMENAPALLRKLDRNGDGQLTPDELRPARPQGGRGGGRAIPDRPRLPGTPEN